MSGRHKFDKLREEMDRDPVRRRRVEEKKRAFDALLDLAELAELRKNRGVTQAELAERLGVSQPNIAKIEAAAREAERHDEDDVQVPATVVGPGSGKTVASRALPGLHISTLSSYVEALGGRLELRATFPEHHETDVAVPIATTAVEAAVAEDQDTGRDNEAEATVAMREE